MKRRLTLIFLIVVFALALLALWVATDPYFIIYGDEINLISNPSFDEPVRGFADWGVAGCMSYVIPPKESAAKAGPVAQSGLCYPGNTAVISQTFPISGTEIIGFTYREVLKGAGNHLTITFTDGDSWEWVARNTGAQSTAFAFTPIVTSTIPISTTQLIIWIEAYYQTGIGMKFTDVTVTGE